MQLRYRKEKTALHIAQRKTKNKSRNVNRTDLEKKSNAMYRKCYITTTFCMQRLARLKVVVGVTVQQRPIIVHFNQRDISN